MTADPFDLARLVVDLAGEEDRVEAELARALLAERTRALAAEQRAEAAERSRDLWLATAHAAADRHSNWSDALAVALVAMAVKVATATTVEHCKDAARDLLRAVEKANEADRAATVDAMNATRTALAPAAESGKETP